MQAAAEIHILVEPDIAGWSYITLLRAAGVETDVVFVCGIFGGYSSVVVAVLNFVAREAGNSVLIVLNRLIEGVYGCRNGFAVGNVIVFGVSPIADSVYRHPVRSVPLENLVCGSPVGKGYCNIPGCNIDFEGCVGVHRTDSSLVVRGLPFAVGFVPLDYLAVANSRNINIVEAGEGVASYCCGVDPCESAAGVVVGQKVAVFGGGSVGCHSKFGLFDTLAEDRDFAVGIGQCHRACRRYSRNRESRCF